MPHETFLAIKSWKTADLMILRSLITREVHRRMDCYESKAEHQALQRSGMESGNEEMGDAGRARLAQDELP